MTTSALLYEHEDGRHAVSFVDPAPFTSGQPKWHRVGPVEVHTGWLPMESAPKDEGQRFIGLTTSGRAITAEPMYCVYDAGPVFRGWHEIERGSLVPVDLTGWMPFPA